MRTDVTELAFFAKFPPLPGQDALALTANIVDFPNRQLLCLRHKAATMDRAAIALQSEVRPLRAW